MDDRAAFHDALRRLPSVDALLQDTRVGHWVAAHGRESVVGALRGALDAARESILAGACSPGHESILAEAERLLWGALRPSLRQVINATGVILHTNLGRAPLSAEVLDAMRRAGDAYSNLEYDLAAGARGSRYTHAEALLCRVTGAEAALLVNNNAAAVLLVLSALVRGREVVISRGQLVEIGGGFRIPEVMAQSGARLVEVGTTNRTYLRDYAEALGPEVAAIMRVHSSNYRIRGFTAQPSLAEMVALAHDRGLPLIDDLGSGTLLDTRPFGLEHEPMVQESVAAGADLVTFSGDKLLGGPQAGIVVGRADPIEQLKRFPLTRALRVDKTTIAGVQANLLHYLRGEALERVPVWQMIAISREEVEARARALMIALGPRGEGCELWPGTSMVGGGSLPDETLPTTLLALSGDALAHSVALRAGEPPVVARVTDDRLVLDLRTVLPAQQSALLRRLTEVLGQ